MALMEEKDPRFRNLERRAGLFVLVAFLAATVGLVVAGGQRDWLRAQRRILFQADSALNLAPGMSVKYRGFRIGKVRAVELTTDGRVEVVLGIFSEHARRIRQDSVAELSPESTFGDFVVEIVGGDPGAAEVPERGSIQFRRAITMNDVARELETRLEAVLVELRKAAGDAGGDARATLANSRQLTEGLVQTQLHADASLQRLDASLARTLDTVNDELLPALRDTTKSAESMMRQGNATMASVNDSLPSILSKTDRALEDTLAITAELRRTASGMTEVLENVETLLHDTQGVVDSVKQVWPIRNYVPPAEDKRREVDGYE